MYLSFQKNIELVPWGKYLYTFPLLPHCSSRSNSAPRHTAARSASRHRQASASRRTPRGSPRTASNQTAPHDSRIYTEAQFNQEWSQTLHPLWQF